MYQLAETKDSRIAQYSFGRSIAQYGMTVFSCTSARKGKKIFGNETNFNFKDKLSSKLKYLKLKKNISIKDYYKVLKIGEPGINLDESYIRKYPGKSLA